MLSRWEITGVQLKEHKVLVKDYILKRVRVYSVPNLASASLDGDFLRVITLNGKVMIIGLPSGSRAFVDN